MVEDLDIFIHYLPGSPALEMTDYGDWVDLYCYEDTDLLICESCYISQGISMALPEGYEAIMASRSSTFKRYGILQQNGIGVIDNMYRGTDDIWMFPAYATRDIHIDKGTRICQFRVQKKQPKLNFISMQSLGETNRNGFGSSGV